MHSEFQKTAIDCYSSGGNIQRLLWTLKTISVQLEKIENVWGEKLGLSGPQWLMMLALVDLNVGSGVAVNKLAKLLKVDPSFITTQTKALEKLGFITREPSIEDARIVLMSPTPRFQKLSQKLLSRRAKLYRVAFSKFDPKVLDELVRTISGLPSSLEMAATFAQLDADSSWVG